MDLLEEGEKTNKSPSGKSPRAAVGSADGQVAGVLLTLEQRKAQLANNVAGGLQPAEVCLLLNGEVSIRPDFIALPARLLSCHFTVAKITDVLLQTNGVSLVTPTDTEKSQGCPKHDNWALDRCCQRFPSLPPVYPNRSRWWQQ